VAEDRGFEPLRAFTQHAFQVWDGPFQGVRQASLSVKLASASGFGRVRTRTTETKTETKRAAFSAVSRAVPELELSASLRPHAGDLAVSVDVPEADRLLSSHPFDLRQGL
jgi:hypothetical protein